MPLRAEITNKPLMTYSILATSRQSLSGVCEIEEHLSSVGCFALESRLRSQIALSMLWRTILFSLTFFDGIPSREQRTIAFAGNHDGVQATVVIQTLSTQINELEESDDTGFKWQKGIEGVANTVLGYSSETHITAPGRVPAKLAGLWDPVPPSRAGDGASQSGGSARSGAVAMLYVPSAQHQISSSPTPGNLKTGNQN